LASNVVNWRQAQGRPSRFLYASLCFLTTLDVPLRNCVCCYVPASVF
jgi:hypothetical protein